MSYPLNSFSYSLVEREKGEIRGAHAYVCELSLARRKALLFSTLLLVVLVLLTGCPDEATPPAPDAPANLTVVATMSMQVTLSWDRVAGADEYRVYRATAGAAAERIAADTTITALTHTDGGLTNGTTYIYTVRAVNGNGESIDGGVALAVPNNLDNDNDLLIDISSLEQLDNMRHNLAGTDYRASASASGVQCGVVANTDCRGYELTRSLDFAAADSYESGTINDDWRPDDLSDPDNATNNGWVPIGLGTTNTFSTLFEGNGNTITNLYTRGSTFAGLFGATENAVISNIGIINARLYGGTGADIIGGLVGFALNTTIVASYASGGTIEGGTVGDSVGGLVGNNTRGVIVASYASGMVNGGVGVDNVGGLAGNQAGNINASYATGNLNGGADNDQVGGLSGLYSSPTIVAVYSTANSDGDAGTNDNVGGLVGFGSTGMSDITASYGFGMVTGNEGTSAFTPDPPSGVTSANALTADNAGDEWNDADSFSLGAWDFGTASQPPALRYADYDGMVRTGDMGETMGGMFACANADSPPADAILIVKCGELIPGQR